MSRVTHHNARTDQAIHLDGDHTYTVVYLADPTTLRPVGDPIGIVSVADAIGPRSSWRWQGTAYGGAVVLAEGGTAREAGWQLARAQFAAKAA